MRPKSPVTKSVCHQPRPKIIDMKDHPMFRWFVGKAVARQIRHNHVKRILGPSTVRFRIGQHGNYFCETIERIRIAVRKNDRKWIRAIAALMDQVDTDVVQFCLEMSELVQRRFVFWPIINILPIINEFLQIIHVGARTPICAFDLIRPARLYQPLPQVAQNTTLCEDHPDQTDQVVFGCGIFRSQSAGDRSAHRPGKGSGRCRRRGSGGVLRSRTRLLHVRLLRSMSTRDGMCKMFVLPPQGIYSGSFAGRQEQLAANAPRDPLERGRAGRTR